MVAKMKGQVQELVCYLKAFYASNQKIPEPYYTIFLTLYTLVSLSAFGCNALLLTILHIYKKKKPRFKESRYKVNTSVPPLVRRRRTNSNDKTRDHLICYLASSDLLLSLAMPLIALDALTIYWPLGLNTETLAKLSHAVPSAIVHSSSMIIALIAINCYRQILHSNKQQLYSSFHTQ